MSTTLHFLRHGRLEREAAGILHGPDDPVQLSQAGREQIVAAAERLKISGVDILVSSPETRTRESADIVGQSLGIEPVFDQGLLGRSWGAWAGRKWGDVERELSALSLDERYSFVPPGGESWGAFERRALDAVNRLVAGNTGKAIVLISHGSVIRVLLPKVFKLSVRDSLRYYPDYASICSVRHDGADYVDPRLPQS